MLTTNTTDILFDDLAEIQNKSESNQYVTTEQMIQEGDCSNRFEFLGDCGN